MSGGRDVAQQNVEFSLLRVKREALKGWSGNLYEGCF